MHYFMFFVVTIDFYIKVQVDTRLKWCIDVHIWIHFSFSKFIHTWTQCEFLCKLRSEFNQQGKKYIYRRVTNIFVFQGNHLSFKNITMSLMRTFAMMLGEIDFVGTYVQPFFKSETDVILPFPWPTFFILSLFMVLMPILLMNLLIGLAVGDIESVRRNAQLKRLAMQVSD